MPNAFRNSNVNLDKKPASICGNLCNRWTKKTQNKPISKPSGITLTPCILRTNNDKPQTAKQKNKPKRTHLEPVPLYHRITYGTIISHQSKRMVL